VVSPVASTAPGDAPSPSVLTRRERQVAILLGGGFTTNREIASALEITEGTAANYVQRVMTRLDLRTRAQVAGWAAEHRLDAAHGGS
jgi:DNA-binding NarL/FixJ family response regulator